MENRLGSKTIFELNAIYNKMILAVEKSIRSGLVKRTRVLFANSNIISHEISKRLQ